MSDDQPRIVIGVDPGSQIIGWALLDGESLQSHGTMNYPKGDFEERRGRIREEIEPLAAMWRMHAKQLQVDHVVVAIEDPMSRSLDVAKKLATIRTMIEEAAIRHRALYMTVHPSSWQALVKRLYPHLKLLRLAPKELSRQGAKAATGLDLPQDTADAYWVARWGAREVKIVATEA